MAKSKIIKDLVKNNINVEIALMQLKVMLYNTEKKEICEWIDCELKGYMGKNIDVPNYRISNGILKGNFLNYNTKAFNVAIPLRNEIDDKIKEFCSKITFSQGVAALQELCENASKNGWALAIEVPPDILPYIQKYSNISMTCLLSAQVEVSVSVVKNILSTIQYRLLEIMLLLEEEFGSLDDLDIDFTKKTNDKAIVIQKKIYNIMVDNHIEIGDQNKIVKSDILTGI